jgi:hypothetical protein
MSKFLQSEINKMITKSADTDKTDDVRFSLTFSKFDNRRIEYLRRKLKLSKQEFLHSLIIAAISDIELSLGLIKPDGNDFDFDHDYNEILRSKKPISSIVKDE